MRFHSDDNPLKHKAFTSDVSNLSMQDKITGSAFKDIDMNVIPRHVKKYWQKYLAGEIKKGDRNYCYVRMLLTQWGFIQPLKRGRKRLPEGKKKTRHQTKEERMELYQRSRMKRKFETF
jgi:hypothetical protein